MFQKLIVPVDDWSTAITAVKVASRMAAAVGGEVELVTVVNHLSDVPLARSSLEHGLQDIGVLPVVPTYRVLAADSVAHAIAQHVEATPSAMVLMSTHGHGRSAAVFGSTCDELLRALYGPIIVVGPHVVDLSGRLDGRYVVPLDGSHRADGVLPIVAAWSAEFGGTPWLIAVGDDSVTPSDATDSGYVASRARELQRRTAREVEFEVLHSGHAAKSIAQYAEELDTSLIFLSTHGRTGLDRLRAGSVAASVIRHATCPVVLFRPPELRDASALVASGSSRA